jgi:hypothetical protein
MPTHQGKTQTDIVIAEAGNSSRHIDLDANIEFLATYSGSTNYQYKDNVPSADHEDSNYELKLLSLGGSTIATFAAKYTADPVPGTATVVTTTRTNTFNPAPNGNTPTFPASPATYVSRDWVISSTRSGSTFAGFDCRWEFASTVISGSGVSVSQSVNTQNNTTLTVTLTYTSGGSTILTVVVTCFATATASGGGVNLGSPSVSDTIQP